MKGRPVPISVIGAGDADTGTCREAHAVGRCVAERGGVVVCGGLGGVMEAACRGAAEAGGVAVAILPGSDEGAANPWATVIIPTGLGHARNVLVVQAGRAVVALPGAMGTLSEVSIALKIGRPVVGVRAWGDVAGVEVAADAEEAVARAFARVKERSGGGG